MATVFVPEKLIVGFNQRGDTFTSKLGYITYVDKAGKHCQAASMEKWRDKNIPLEHIDNKPMSGFVFNRGVTRSGYFRSSGDKVRIWDPRDFEIEIPLSNFLGILACCDSSKREIIGEMVYGWENGKLLLLPVNSEEYETAMAATKNLDVVISADSLVPGQWYSVKKQKFSAVYITKGTITNGYDEEKNTLTQKKGLVFWCPETKTFDTLKIERLGGMLEPLHPEFDTIQERYLRSEHVAPKDAKVKMATLTEVRDLLKLFANDDVYIKGINKQDYEIINVYFHPVNSSATMAYQDRYKIKFDASKITTLKELATRHWVPIATPSSTVSGRPIHTELGYQSPIIMEHVRDMRYNQQKSIAEITDYLSQRIEYDYPDFRIPVLLANDGTMLYIYNRFGYF